MQFDKTFIDYEDFGDEIVFIHIKNGSYFSLRGKAIEIFRLLKNPCSKEEILSLINDNYDQREQQLIQDVLEIFESQGLFINSGKTEPLNWQADPQLGTTQFVQHNDMQDLIKLDPIHDVSDSGWPNAKSSV